MSGFCARLTEATGCHIAAMFLQNYHGLGSNFFASDGLDAAILERYDREFAGENLLMERALLEMLAGRMSVSEQYVTDREWKASSFYNEFCKPQDAFHVSGACIAYDNGVSSMLTLARNKKGGTFTADELSLLRLLLPHLRNVLEVQRRIAFLQLRAELGWQVVDRLLADPSENVSGTAEAMPVHFGLTRAESRVALRLVRGSSLRQISEETKTSINTVKTHLKHLMQRTGTARQSALVAYLLRGMLRLSGREDLCSSE